MISDKIKEELKKCILCGLCKSNCPVFLILREEEFSSRGRIELAKINKNTLDKLINEIVFSCTLCKSCEHNCPNNIKLTEIFLELREKAKKSEKHKKIKERILKYNNPIGESDDWVCC